GVPAVALRHGGAAELEHDPGRAGRGRGHGVGVLVVTVRRARGFSAGAFPRFYANSATPPHARGKCRGPSPARPGPSPAGSTEGGASRILSAFLPRLRSVMTLRRFVTVDVFADHPGAGNPLAVVLDAAGLDDDAMQAIARWTRLPETTFVFPAPS